MMLTQIFLSAQPASRIGTNVCPPMHHFDLNSWAISGINILDQAVFKKQTPRFDEAQSLFKRFSKIPPLARRKIGISSQMAALHSSTQGITQSHEPSEKNWCALQRALLLFEQPAVDLKSVAHLLQQLAKNEQNQIMLPPEDMAVFHQVQQRFAMRFGDSSQ